MTSESPRKDHLWVLVIIAACALLEVWASWVTIGSMSGFPELFKTIPTDWTLAVTTEAYWGYALYSWLAAAPGPRSRRFAMWSASAVFLLSLTGQGSAHLVKPGTPPPTPLIVFVTALPVIVLALIAVLVHLRQADREETEKAAQAKAEAERMAAIERAENDDRTALRAQIAEMTEAHEAELCGLREALEAERCARSEAERQAAEREALRVQRDEANTALEAEKTARQAAQDARAEAERQAAELEARTEALTRKLARAAGQKKTRNAGSGKSRKDPDTAVPNDVDAQAAALSILAAEPDLSGAELARRTGMSERWGQAFKKQLAARPAGGEEDGGGPS